MARQWLEQFGQPLRAAQIADATRQPRSLRYQASSPELEIAAAADWAARQLRTDAAFRAWILVRDLNTRRAQVVDALDAVLAPDRFGLREAGGLAPYAVAGGTPLADYAPVRAALQLPMAASGLVSFQRFGELLRTPDWHASISEAAIAARLELALRSCAPAEAELTAWLARAEEAARAEGMSLPAALQRLQTAVRLLQSLRGAQFFSAWVPIWMAAIEAGPWIARSQWSSVEFQAAERFREQRLRPAWRRMPSSACSRQQRRLSAY